MSKRLVAILAFVLLAQSAFADKLHENEAIVGGGSSETDGLWISSPSIYLRHDSPGLAIGTVKAPESDRSFAYVVLVKKGDSHKELPLYDGQSGSSGSAALSSGFVNVAGRKATFEYSLKLDAKGMNPADEQLSINGTKLEMAKGRLVLVDLSAEKITWKQVRIDLPKPGEVPTETAHVEAQSKKLLRLLRENPEVRAYLK